jgi:hypothetical protein
MQGAPKKQPQKNVPRPSRPVEYVPIQLVAVSLEGKTYTVYGPPNSKIVGDPGK